MSSPLVPEKFTITNILLDTLDPENTQDHMPHTCDSDGNSAICQAARACTGVRDVLKQVLVSPHTDSFQIAQATNKLNQCAASLDKLDVNTDLSAFLSVPSSERYGLRGHTNALCGSIIYILGSRSLACSTVGSDSGWCDGCERAVRAMTGRSSMRMPPMLTVTWAIGLKTQH
jgi:hypothetical protein